MKDKGKGKPTTKKQKKMKAWVALSRRTGNYLNVSEYEPSEYRQQDPEVEYVPCTITYQLPTHTK